MTLGSKSFHEKCNFESFVQYISYPPGIRPSSRWWWYVCCSIETTTLAVWCEANYRPCAGQVTTNFPKVKRQCEALRRWKLLIPNKSCSVHTVRSNHSFKPPRQSQTTMDKIFEYIASFSTLDIDLIKIVDATQKWLYIHLNCKWGWFNKAVVHSRCPLNLVLLALDLWVQLLLRWKLIW